jgi:type II secretory pathway pseudopilin PulG
MTRSTSAAVAATTPPPAEASAPECGLSLIELLAALAFVVLLLSSAMTGVVSHSNQRRVHTEQLLAMAACRSTLEFLRGVDIAVLPTYNGTGFDVPGQDGQPGGLPPLEGDLDGLPGEISIVANRTTGVDTLYTVTVAVRWRGATRGGFLQMQALMGERR